MFLLRVDHQLDDWPEKGQRETKWFDPAEAAGLVDEGGLAEIIRQAVVTGAAATGSQKQRRKHRIIPPGSADSVPVFPGFSKPRCDPMRNDVLQVTRRIEVQGT